MQGRAVEARKSISGSHEEQSLAYSGNCKKTRAPTIEQTWDFPKYSEKH